MKSIMMRSGRETGKKKEIAGDDNDWVVWGRSGRSMMMLVSAILRVVLIVYGEWQDTHMDVHYIDIDYLVFSDAASLMASSESPYQRSTFRYSPLLPLLLIPNSLLYASWGKLLFSAADLLTGHLIYCILTLRGVPKKQSIACEAAWLFNPFTFTIGTRGNCEPVVCAIILCFLLCLMKDKIIQAGLWYGLVVHFRIYPIIYCLSILIILDGPHQFLNSWTSEQSDKSSISFLNFRQLLFGINFKNILALFNRKRIQFAIVSGGCFFLLTGLCYLFYGHEFLNEALLYHLTRTDHRHNFSIYFYHIYLHHEHDFTLLERLLAFLPQFTVQLVLIFFFAKDFIFCIFVQTLAFVAFNKVITAQYFVWFFCLLPLILPWTKLRIRWNGLICILVWISAQIHWLGWAYLLEFKGINVFVQLWLASIVFLMANTFVLVILIANHQFSPLLGQRILVSSNLDSKKKE